jgi:hypothetical protein
MARTQVLDEHAIAKIEARGFAPLDSIADLPHVTCADVRGRVFHLHGFYDDEQGWYAWIPRSDGKIMPIVAVPVEAMYYSKSPEDENDLYCRFLDFVYQIASWQKPSILARGIQSDLNNLGASLEKLELIHQSRSPKSRSARMAATELEYMFMVCRSMLDLLQETISCLWVSIEFADKTFAKKKLSRSFAKMALSDGKRMASSEIADRYGLPANFADTYADSGEFLEWLREYRDRLVHGGNSFELVFVCDQGFGIRTTDPPFSHMPIWSATNTLPNDIGSMKSAACFIITSTMRIFDRFTDLLASNIQWPPAFAPDYKLFVRGNHIGALNRLQDGIDVAPWYGGSTAKNGSVHGDAASTHV